MLKPLQKKKLQTHKMETDNNYLNASNGENTSKLSDIKNGSFFCKDGVDRGCDNPLKIIFDTLLLQKKSKQQELADFCSVDKAYISRVVHGLQIPPLQMRLKISSFFRVDSSLIWRYQDINYIKKILTKDMKE